MKKMPLLFAILTVSGCYHHKPPTNSETQSTEDNLTPGAVVAASLPQEWRLLDPENTLYITLDTGIVVAEMIPELAPKHVTNTKQLVRQGIFDGSQFYRVLDAFVAQGGPIYTDESEQPELSEGSYNIPAEFTWTGDLGADYLMFDQQDGYADETGFIKSYALGRDLATDEHWLLHCYGALAMGRTNDVNTGGTALYVVNGPAQRYLDRNTTVFGRVVVGMEHIQALYRSQDLNGAVDLKGKNTISSIQVAADLPADQIKNIEVLSSQSASFKQLLKARKNRTGTWFVHQHDYMDACGVPIPVRLKP